jgi:hypothetical protein
VSTAPRVGDMALFELHSDQTIAFHPFDPLATVLYIIVSPPISWYVQVRLLVKLSYSRFQQRRLRCFDVRFGTKGHTCVPLLTLHWLVLQPRLSVWYSLFVGLDSRFYLTTSIQQLIHHQLLPIDNKQRHPNEVRIIYQYVITGSTSYSITLLDTQCGPTNFPSSKDSRHSS